MDLDTPESVTAIQQSVREFCAREVSPFARQWDEHGALPEALFTGIAELGLAGVLVPETLGGAGLDLFALSAVIETLARTDGATAFALAAMAGPAVTLASTHLADPVRAGLLGSVISGDAVLSHALGVFSAAGSACEATRDAGRWRLHGTLAAVPLGPRATHVVALAESPEGPTMFVIPTHVRGVRWGDALDALGLRACELRALHLDAVALEDDHRLGAVGAGRALAASATMTDDVCVAAVSLGLGEGALGAAARYAKDRRQFGRPIADLQAIQWMLADTRTELDAARVLLLRATLTGSPREAAMARRAAGGAASRGCHRALQVHGGYGYTREFPVERALRDAKMCEVEADPEAVTAATLTRELSSSNARRDC